MENRLTLDAEGVLACSDLNRRRELVRTFVREHVETALAMMDASDIGGMTHSLVNNRLQDALRELHS